jgi:hypothetical protein
MLHSPDLEATLHRGCNSKRMKFARIAASAPVYRCRNSAGNYAGTTPDVQEVNRLAGLDGMP